MLDTLMYPKQLLLSSIISNTKAHTMNKLYKITVVLSAAIYTLGCNSHKSDHKYAEEQPIYNQNQRAIDSIERNNKARAIINEALCEQGLYDFSKDTVRKEWVASHPYMCYKSYSRTNETCGYDKNGKRKVNQIFGPFKCNNTFCFDRRHKMIVWDYYSDAGVHSSFDMKIVKVEEYPYYTSFTTYTADNQKIVFNVPDDGKRIYSLTEDETITFTISE
jgi:hypothetical protein